MIIFIILILCKIISGVLGNLWSNSENVKIIALSSRYFCKVSTAISHLHMIYPAAPRGSEATPTAAVGKSVENPVICII